MKTQNSSVFLFILLVAALCLIGWAAHGQTNEVATNAPAPSLAKLTPQAAAYTFKEWAGVILSVCTMLYTSLHIVFLAVVHYGGCRKIIADFVGKWPDGFSFFAPKITKPFVPSKPFTPATPDAPALNAPESPAQPKV